MKRTLAAIAMIVITPLFLLILVFWLHSYWRMDFLAKSANNNFFSVRSQSGMLQIEYGDYPLHFVGCKQAGPFNYDSRSDSLLNLWALSQNDTNWHFLGLGYEKIGTTDVFQVRRTYYMPHWMLAVVLGIFPLCELISFLRWRKTLPGDFNLRSERSAMIFRVSPGPTDTELFSEGKTEDQKKAFGKMAALGRLGQPDDLADVVALLASDDAHWITGQTIRANGGTI